MTHVDAQAHACYYKAMQPGRDAARFKSSGGTGKRQRPMLATSVSIETDERLRAYTEATGVPMGQVIDRAIAMYLDQVTK